jgi:hypothetical protein
MQSSTRQSRSATGDVASTLEQCLRTELAAVETYDLAIANTTHVGLHHELQEIGESHFRRAEKLRMKLASMGEQPPKTSGAWGAFAKAVQIGADLLGDKPAMAALEAGEARCLSLYEKQLSRSGVGAFIESELLPEQRRTHQTCHALRKFVNEPS